jgi:hypothetical protein
MSDLLSKVKRLLHRAEECTKLAEVATSDKTRWHYKNLAERCLAMARAELTKAEEIALYKES